MNTPGKQRGLYLREGDDEDGENPAPKARSDPANALQASTSTTAAVSECPLCTPSRLFTNNDELDVSIKAINLCFSRDPICSAQVKDDRHERRKTNVGVQHLKEWEGGSAEQLSAQLRVGCQSDGGNWEDDICFCNLDVLPRRLDHVPS